MLRGRASQDFAMLAPSPSTRIIALRGTHAATPSLPSYFRFPLMNTVLAAIIGVRALMRYLV